MPDIADLAQSDGETGLTPAQSRVSAVMENIELWHADPRLVDSGTGSSGLPYDIRAFKFAQISPLTGRVALD